MPDIARASGSGFGIACTYEYAVEDGLYPSRCLSCELAEPVDLNMIVDGQ